MDIVSINFKYWALQTAAMMLTAFALPGLKVKGPLGAFLAVAALAYLNATYWDWALFFKLPDSFTMKAILLVLVNGAIFWVIVKLLPGIEIEGVWPALIAPMVFAVLSVLIPHLATEIDWVSVGHTVTTWISGMRDYFQSAATTPTGTP
jgi:putative membrane protein